MSATLHDMPFFKYHYEVGMAYCGKTMCYDDACASVHKAVEALLHGLLTFRVEGRRCFVEDKDWSVTQYGACYRQALPLSA